MKKTSILLFIILFSNLLYSSDINTFNYETDISTIINYIDTIKTNNDIDKLNKAEEILTLKYLFSSNNIEKNKLERALNKIKELNETRKSSVTRIKIPCDEIKEFIAKRRYKAIPHHVPTSGWAYETKNTEPFTVGLIGSKESTGANDFQDWAYWNRLWLKFDLSSLAIYDKTKIIDAEIAIYNVKTIIGQVDEEGLPCRVIRTEPGHFKDANHSTLLPSDANTPYDYIYHEYNNGSVLNKVKNGLKTYGYGHGTEFAKLRYLDKAVEKWLTDGNNGIVLFSKDIDTKDFGNKKHIKDIKKENIFLFVDIEE